MVLAIDGGRIAEAAVGTALLLALAAICVLHVRAWRLRRREPQLPTIAELVRFGPVLVADPLLFGGGAPAAAQRRREDAVAYGYLAVAEEFAPADGGPPWCTMTVSLPGRVPLLSVDRAGPPQGLVPVLTGDAGFDAVFRVSAGSDVAQVTAVLTPPVRDLLRRAAVQRLMLRDSELLVRTPDGVTLEPDVRAGLVRLVEAFLAATPSFVTHDLAGRPLPDTPDGPLKPGLYGIDVADEADETRRSSALN
jgi:hypothetical protein